MRITESKLRRIIQDVILESKELNENKLKNAIAGFGLGLSALATTVAGCDTNNEVVPLEQIIKSQHEEYSKRNKAVIELDRIVFDLERQIRKNKDPEKAKVLKRLLAQARLDYALAKRSAQEYKEMVIDR